jgi:predicted DNA-binding transcriptional regulator YafY
MSSFGPAAPPPFLSLLARARLEQRLVRLTYRSAHDVESDRDVAVLGLAFRGGGWLAACHCRLRDALRAFHVSRIAAAQLGGTLPPGGLPFDGRCFAGLSLRDPPDAPALRVAIRLEPALGAVASALLPGLAEVSRDGAAVVHLRTSRPEALIALCLSLGDAAELIHPPELARVARQLRARTAGAAPLT